VVFLSHFPSDLLVYRLPVVVVLQKALTHPPISSHKSCGRVYIFMWCSECYLCDENVVVDTCLMGKCYSVILRLFC
jgi:hypothetical protein